MKATFLTLVPSPYMRELFRAMHRDGRIVPDVMYATMRAPGFDWGNQSLESYERVLAPPRWPFTTAMMPNTGVISSLARSSADVFVVCGYRLPTMQIAMHWLRRSRRPWVFFGERPGVSKRTSLGNLIRSLAKHPAVHWPDGIAAVGTLAVEAYRRECAITTPVVNLPYFTDLGPFRRKPATPGREQHRLRVLYCGQLILRKGVDLLLDAVCELACRSHAIQLTLVGDGDQRRELQQRVPSHLKDQIRFTGFKPPDQLPDYYREADVLVLPSRHDGWGVVVNQAFGASLPVIASDRVGAANDLIVNDVNGFIFPTGNKQELIRILDRMSSESELCRRLSQGASETAKAIDLSCGVAAWHKFLDDILVRHQSRSV